MDRVNVKSSFGVLEPDLVFCLLFWISRFRLLLDSVLAAVEASFSFTSFPTSVSAPVAPFLLAFVVVIAGCPVAGFSLVTVRSDVEDREGRT